MDTLANSSLIYQRTIYGYIKENILDILKSNLGFIREQLLDKLENISWI